MHFKTISRGTPFPFSTIHGFILFNQLLTRFMIHLLIYIFSNLIYGFPCDNI